MTRPGIHAHITDTTRRAAAGHLARAAEHATTPEANAILHILAESCIAEVRFREDMAASVFGLPSPDDEPAAAFLRAMDAQHNAAMAPDCPAQEYVRCAQAREAAEGTLRDSICL